MSSLQDRRVWIAGGIVAALIIVAASWFMFISPTLSSADDLRSQASGQRAQNAETANTVNELKTKSAHLSKYTNTLALAVASLPVDSGLSALTRQWNLAAKADRVTLSSISVGMVKALSGPDANGASGSVGSGSTSDGGTTDGSSADGATPTTPTSTSTAAPGGLYAIPVTVVTAGTLAHQTRFLEDLRSAGPRYGLVTGAQFAPAAGAKEASLDGGNSMTTQVTVFSEPQSPSQVRQLRKLLSGDIGS